MANVVTWSRSSRSRAHFVARDAGSGELAATPRAYQALAGGTFSSSICFKTSYFARVSSSTLLDA